MQSQRSACPLPILSSTLPPPRSRPGRYSLPSLFYDRSPPLSHLIPKPPPFHLPPFSLRKSSVFFFPHTFLSPYSLLLIEILRVPPKSFTCSRFFAIRLGQIVLSGPLPRSNLLGLFPFSSHSSIKDQWPCFLSLIRHLSPLSNQ